MEKITEEHPVLVDKILDLRKQLLKDQPNIRCLVITALEEESDQPVVVYHGDQLEYTAMAVTVAKVLRKRILDRVDGNDVHVHKPQQTLGAGVGTEQGSDQNPAGTEHNPS